MVSLSCSVCSIQHYILTFDSHGYIYCCPIGPTHLFHPRLSHLLLISQDALNQKRHREPQRLFTVLFYNSLIQTNHFLKTVYGRSRPITRLKSGSERSHELLMRAAPKYRSLLSASPLPSVLTCPLSIYQIRQRRHCGRFSLRDLGADSTRRTGKAGR